MHDIYVRFSESEDSEQALLTRPELFLCQTAALCKKDLCPLPFEKVQIWDTGDAGLKIRSSSFTCLLLFYYSNVLYQATGYAGQKVGKKELIFRVV